MATDPSARRRRVGQVQDLDFLPRVRLFVCATARLSAASRCCGAETKYGPRSWNSLRHTGKQTGNLSFRPVQKFARLKYAQLHSERGNLFFVGLWAAGEQHNASVHSFSFRSYKAQRKHSLPDVPHFLQGTPELWIFPESQFFPLPCVPRLGTRCPQSRQWAQAALQELALLFVHRASGFLI